MSEQKTPGQRAEEYAEKVLSGPPISDLNWLARQAYIAGAYDQEQIAKVQRDKLRTVAESWIEEANADIARGVEYDFAFADPRTDLVDDP